ncbi:MAG: sigma-70 family RNA polymerase sigma factor [Elusimicrobia bacterium]|nr:sigma-70 family RNA polymerase sigma factor [Elusimicrobiota bacterium]
MTENMAQGFAEFYEEWFPKVYNYARHRTGSATRADEVVSETFSRALRSWPSFDPAKGDRRTWLFSIAFRAVADHYRSEKRRGWFGLDFLLGLEPREPGPEHQLEQAQESGRVVSALGDLSQEHREIVSLKCFGGLTNRAIAKLMSLTETNVAVILFRSVRLMRKNLSGVEA